MARKATPDNLRFEDKANLSRFLTIVSQLMDRGGLRLAMDETYCRNLEFMTLALVCVALSGQNGSAWKPCYVSDGETCKSLCDGDYPADAGMAGAHIKLQQRPNTGKSPQRPSDAVRLVCCCRPAAMDTTPPPHAQRGGSTKKKHSQLRKIDVLACSTPCQDSGTVQSDRACCGGRQSLVSDAMFCLSGLGRFDPEVVRPRRLKSSSNALNGKPVAFATSRPMKLSILAAHAF